MQLETVPFLLSLKSGHVLDRAEAGCSGVGRQGGAVHYAVLCSVAQSCLTLCDPMDCGPPGSSAHGILQARILEWVAMPSSRGSSQPRDKSPALAGEFFTTSNTTS